MSVFCICFLQIRSWVDAHENGGLGGDVRKMAMPPDAQAGKALYLPLFVADRQMLVWFYVKAFEDQLATS